MQYSIWLIPPEPVYSKVQQVINSLAEKYQSPIIEPHITVLGKIEKDFPEIKENIVKLTRSLQPLHLKLGPISFSTTYYQSVFVRIESSAELLALNLRAKQIFERKNDVYMPHASLLYGDHNMKFREKVASGLQLPMLDFVVKKLVVVPSLPDPKDWKHLITINL